MHTEAWVPIETDWEHLELLADDIYYIYQIWRCHVQYWEDKMCLRGAFLDLQTLPHLCRSLLVGQKPWLLKGKVEALCTYSRAQCFIALSISSVESWL